MIQSENEYFTLLPSTCTVCTVSMSLVTLITYPSASDESRAVQLTVIVVAVLLVRVRDEGKIVGAKTRLKICLQHYLPLMVIFLFLTTQLPLG